MKITPKEESGLEKRLARLEEEQVKTRRSNEDLLFNLDSDNIRSLTADKIDMTAGQFSVYDANENGNLLFRAGNRQVKLAGFAADRNSLYHGNSFTSSDLFFCAGGSDSRFNIAGSGSQKGWVLKAGSKFGVKNDGEVYCSALRVARGSVIGHDITDGDGIRFGKLYSDPDTASSETKLCLSEISDGISGGSAAGITFRSAIDRVGRQDDECDLTLNPLEATLTDGDGNGFGIFKGDAGGTSGVALQCGGTCLWIDKNGIIGTNALTIRMGQEVPAWVRI